MRTLASLRNVFLAPLAMVKTFGNEIHLPSANAVSTVSLHDNHNIEIKTISELSAADSIVETDYYLFAPRNFELPSIGKDELITDYRSRVRLALPVRGEQGAAAFEETLQNLLSHVAHYEKSPRVLSTEIVAGSETDAATEAVLEAAKDLSAIIAETLKHRAWDHSKQFFLSHTLMTVPRAAVDGLDKLASQVSETGAMVARIRAAIESPTYTQAAILTFLDEYVSYLYVQYLSSIRAELDRIKIPEGSENDLTYIQSSNRLEALFDGLQEKEAHHRLRFGSRSLEGETDLDRERRLVRLSHLKKFFQSKTFLDISRQRVAKKVSGSLATIGTAAAAMIAAAVEHYSRPEVGGVARQSLVLISFGVMLYVFRDRLKDWAKNRFQEKALQFLPDFEQQLMAQERKIGLVKEWFRVIKTGDLPSDILSSRHAASSTEMERRLPEDVFHCRKIQELNASSSGDPKRDSKRDSKRVSFASRTLHENTRVNLERYLKHMDDPFKNFSDLDPNGRFLHSRSHRVYHFYLCVKTTSGPAERRPLPKRPLTQTRIAVSAMTQTQMLTYRIVLDKNGVVRIEDLG